MKISFDTSYVIQNLLDGTYELNYFNSYSRYKSKNPNRYYHFPKFILKNWILKTVFNDDVIIHYDDRSCIIKSKIGSPQYLVINKVSDRHIIFEGGF